MASDQQKPRIVNDPNVKETYVNRTIGTSYDGTNVTLTFGCARVLPERVDAPPASAEPPPVHLVGRIVLTPSAALELANSLNGILAETAKRTGSSVGKPN